MNSSILFKEKQRFRQWWIFLILIGMDGLFLFGVFTQVMGGQPFGDKPMSDTGLLTITGFLLLLTLLFISSRLDTIIREDGIYVRFFPFHLKFKYFPWENLAKTYVRSYSPIAEYGGWGLRLGIFGKGRAYNVSGNKGLQLEFSDGKRLLIGTRKPDELKKALDRIELRRQ